jgi:enoyl-CoA hydratase/carnithine racemase
VTGPSDLQVRTEGGVLRLHLDRESKRNALSGEVLDAMLAALREVAAEPADAPGGPRLVLLTSAGERVFCAGMDLGHMTRTPPASRCTRAGAAARGRAGDARLPVPVVASVQGLCLAGGVGLVLGCDLVVAADSAAFGLPEVDRGLWPFMVGACSGGTSAPSGRWT